MCSDLIHQQYSVYSAGPSCKPKLFPGPETSRKDPHSHSLLEHELNYAISLTQQIAHWGETR